MSDIGGLVDELIAAGTPPGMAAQIVARAFAAGCASAEFRGQSVDVSAENRREKDRIRKQLQRGNPQKSADVRGIPQMSENASLSKEEKIESNSQEREATKRSVRGQRLPDDWAPSAIDHAVGIELLGSDGPKAELAKFRDHWKQQPGSKGVKLDWDAAWRNWIRRAAEYGGNRNGHRNINATRRSASSDFFAGIAGVAADIAGDGAAPRDAGPEIPLGRVNING